MNVEFNVVSQEQKNSQSFIVFEINKISTLVRKTNVGEFVKSQFFELNYPMSIGKAKWVIILFLNGQYESGGIPNDLICVYLKMVQCEHQSAVFNFDIQFQLGSQYATVSKKDQSVCFDNVRKRWIWTKLIHINEMIKNGSRFIQDDTLMLSVHLKENFTKLAETFPTSSYNNNYFIEKESYAKAESNIEPVNMPANSSPQRHDRSNQSNIGGVYDINHANIPQSSYNTSGSANTSSLFANNMKRICDTNFNYAENEFSDDEEVAQNSTNSTAPLTFMSHVVNGMKQIFGGSKPK